MAVLQRAALNAYLKAPTEAYRIIVVFGPDRGLVAERAAAIASALEGPETDQSDPFARIRLGAEDLQADPDRLANEAYTRSMFGDARFIRVKAHGARNLQQQLTPLLELPPEDAFVIVEAGDLKKGTAFRKAIEKAAMALAIPCYADDAGSLNDLLNEELARHGLSISKDARNRLLSQLGGDRLASRGEIEKLCIYAAEASEITEEDVIALSGDNSVLSGDAISDAAALGQMPLLMDHLARIDAGSLNAQTAILQIQRNFQQLHKARIMADSGVSAAQIVDRMTPPIFFKRKDAVRRQIGLWRTAGLERALSILSQTVLDMRKNPALAHSLLGDALLRIAAAAKRRP